MDEILPGDLFSESYAESRAKFRESFTQVQGKWPGAVLDQTWLDPGKDLSIDWILADGIVDCKKMVIITTAEHGIEGYVGAAVLKRFMDVHLDLLNPEDTGLLCVHAINPWGMDHFRRGNANNVDLNRIFVMDPKALDPTSNPAYGSLDRLLSPTGPARASAWEYASFLTRLVLKMQELGLSTLRNILLHGQYAFPRGLFYGGESNQAETTWYQKMFRSCLSQYPQVVHLDMHTGYGPRYQMSVVNSVLEERSSESLKAHFHYPLVVKSTPGEFYAMSGDLIDYEYGVVQEEFPGVRFYAAAFEFGTLGDSMLASIQSLRTMVLENRAYWYGAASERDAARIRKLFRKLYYPDETRWRVKAIRDADQAVRGILTWEKIIP